MNMDMAHDRIERKLSLAFTEMLDDVRHNQRFWERQNRGIMFGLIEAMVALGMGDGFDSLWRRGIGVAIDTEADRERAYQIHY